MLSDDLIQELLDRWETERAQGRSLSAEQLCRDHPELEEEVRRRILALLSMEPLMAPGGSHCDPSLDSSSRDTQQRPHNHAWIRAGAEPVPGYRLVSLLGRGGFGELWKAIGPGGVEGALKFVSLAEKAGGVELRSLEVIKNIRHPNLLATFGTWQKDGHLIIAMELADRTLMDRFREAVNQGMTGIPGRELLEYFAEAAKGIDYLNEPTHLLDGEKAGIQHRDIKPQNLLLVGGSVKVADFGLARLLTHTSTGHTGSMTPAFAAPEFFQGRTHRNADQYCLAVTYCLLRGGQLPFDGDPAQVMAGHLQDLPNLQMLPELERQPVARALAKDPSQRWQSCREFVQAVARSAEAATTVRQPTESYRAPRAAESPATKTRPRRARRLLIPLVALVMTGIIAGGLSSLNRGCTDDDGRTPKPGDSHEKAPRPSAFVVETTAGSFRVQLDFENSPRASQLFVEYAEKTLFAQKKFLHSSSQVIIDATVPSGNMDRHYRSGASKPGTLAVEGRDYDSKKGFRGTRFLINTRGDPSVPPHYVLGQVVDGMEVIEKIRKTSGVSVYIKSVRAVS